MRAGWLSLLAAICVAITACGESAPATSSLVTDTLQIDLTIGAADGSGPDVFGRVGGLVGTASGDILVADAQFHSIRVFDRDGVFQYALGQEGSGPGELAAPCCLGVDPDGRLWVKESGNARYSVFRIYRDGGQIETTHRLAHSDAGFMAPITFMADGGFVDLGHRPTAEGRSVLSRIARSPAGEELGVEAVTSVQLDALGRHRGPPSFLARSDSAAHRH